MALWVTVLIMFRSTGIGEKRKKLISEFGSLENIFMNSDKLKANRKKVL